MCVLTHWRRSAWTLEKPLQIKTTWPCSESTSVWFTPARLMVCSPKGHGTSKTPPADGEHRPGQWSNTPPQAREREGTVPGLHISFHTISKSLAWFRLSSTSWDTNGLVLYSSDTHMGGNVTPCMVDKQGEVTKFLHLNSPYIRIPTRWDNGSWRAVRSSHKQRIINL